MWNMKTFAFFLLLVLLGGFAIAKDEIPCAANVGSVRVVTPDRRVVHGTLWSPQVRSQAPAVLVLSSRSMASPEVKDCLGWRLDDGQPVLLADIGLSDGDDRAVADILLMAEHLSSLARSPVAFSAEGDFVRVAAKAYAKARQGLVSGFWLINPPQGDEGGWRALVAGSVASDGSVAVDRSLPELLSPGMTKCEWESVRRPQILKTFVENEFGVRPVERPNDLSFDVISPTEDALGGKAETFRVRGTYSGPGGSAEINFRVYLPKKGRPAPVFIHISPRVSDTAADPKGPLPHYVLPAEDIVDRGFAAIAFCTLETALDWKTLPPVPTSGVFKAFGPHDMDCRAPTDWGIVSAWAWGVSRVIDWIETCPRLDASHVAVVGLSRNGKTALAVGAFDSRVALTVSCCSGTGGAKLNHANLPQSESLRDMVIARKWFAPRYWDWVDHDREMPFDQHELLALVAPRLLYVSSAAEDAWAGPPGEFASARLASPVWTLYGKKGLVADSYPKDDETLQDGCIGYHRRKGPHTILKSDWRRYLDFAERHGFGRMEGRCGSAEGEVPCAEVYSVPAGERIYDGYAVTVDGQAAPVSEVRVSAMPFNRRWPGHQRQIDQTELAGMVRFAFTGRTCVTVRPTKPFKTVKVRPLSRKVKPVIRNGVVTFDLVKPGGYSVEFDGYHNNLHVFADAPADYGISVTAPNVRRFGPGEHDVGIVNLKDGETVWLDPGAVVYGMFHASNRTDVAILGRGILDASRIKEKILFPAKGDGKEDCRNAQRWHTIHLVSCRGCRIDGVTIRDSLCYNIGLWGCEDIDIRNVKIVGQWRFNTDGIDLHNCRRGRVRDCFARCFDDVYCFKAHLEPGTDCEDLVFENCVAWADWGKCLEVGVECRADHLRRLRFLNCDCIRGCGTILDVENVDWGEVSDVAFQDIRIEMDDPLPPLRMQKSDDDRFEVPFSRTEGPLLFSGLIRFHHEYSVEKGGRFTGAGRINGVTLRNVDVLTKFPPRSQTKGFDADHTVTGVVFDNVTVNGRRVREPGDFGFMRGAFSDPPTIK